MNKLDLDQMLEIVGKQVVKLRGLGAFDASAEPILLLTEWVYLIVEHLNKKPVKKPTKTTKKKPEKKPAKAPAKKTKKK